MRDVKLWAVVALRKEETNDGRTFRSSTVHGPFLEEEEATEWIDQQVDCYLGVGSAVSYRYSVKEMVRP